MLTRTQQGPDTRERRGAVNDPTIELDVAWGGYYCSREKDSDRYSVFRLLDLNRDAYHIAIFRERFAVPPPLAELLQLSPYIGHAPIDTRALLRERELTLLGARPLVADDLTGYAYYLEEFEATDEEVADLFERIIGFSNEDAVRYRLSLDAEGELLIDEVGGDARDGR